LRSLEIQHSKQIQDSRFRSGEADSGGEEQKIPEGWGDGRSRKRAQSRATEVIDWKLEELRRC